MVIEALVRMGFISQKSSWTTYEVSDVAAGLQDFLICIEMFFAAIAHAHAFPPKEYKDSSTPQRPFFSSLMAMFDIQDVLSDVGERVTAVNRRARRTGSKLGLVKAERESNRVALKDGGEEVEEHLLEDECESPLGLLPTSEDPLCPFESVARRPDPDWRRIADDVEGALATPPLVKLPPPRL